jgi:argininosuccinate lyase
MNATELADYLVRKGMPFRDAHETVGKVVLHGIEMGAELHELDLQSLRGFAEIIEEDVFESLSLEQTLATKSQIGGTARQRVAEALIVARAILGR